MTAGTRSTRWTLTTQQQAVLDYIAQHQGAGHCTQPQVCAGMGLSKAAAGRALLLLTATGLLRFQWGARGMKYYRAGGPAKVAGARPNGYLPRSQAADDTTPPPAGPYRVAVDGMSRSEAVLAAIDAYAARGAVGATTTELAQATGHSVSRMGERVAQMLAAGVLRDSGLRRRGGGGRLAMAVYTRAVPQ